jgi:hypothetical protein
MTAPLCLACEHCVLRAGQALCMSPRNVSAGRSPVNGQPMPPRFQSCAALRTGSWIDVFLGRACGAQGKWFEPKAAAENEAA